ncbi:MAG TPA: hypothetical protein EYO33_27230 [Phycisphaerales bacterium]|nr:hypothetical protein [Phycisphaerales bacterium]
MVPEVASAIVGFLLAHGADPTPLAWDEALANLVKFAVTFVLIGFMSYPVLGPLLSDVKGSKDRTPAGCEGEKVANEPESGKQEVVGWIGVGLVLVFALGWWLARTSLVEVMTEESQETEDHAHTQTEGGQIAMWGDFHAEVVRVESGEVRIYLSDSYNRDIAARFFDAEIVPLPKTDSSDPSPSTGATATPVPAEPTSVTPSPSQESFKTEASLNDTYRFARIDRQFDAYKVKVSTPGWTSSLRFDFDGSKGRRSLPIWCAAPR